MLVISKQLHLWLFWDRGLRMKHTKFKAYDHQIKEMFEVKIINFEDNLVKVNSKTRNHNDTWRCIEDDVCSLLQYIGVKDKNKQEIFEGDICIYTNKKGKHIGQVKFINTLNAFRLVFVEREDFYFITNFDEVIGNIYESPELLNKKLGD